MPFSSVNLAEMQYVRPQLDCAVRDAIANGEPGVVSGANTNTTFDETLQTLSGREDPPKGVIHNPTEERRDELKVAGDAH